MLKILVLGPPAILLNDRAITIQRRQLRTMLYFLACHPDGIGRGNLLSYFWPQSTESDGRRQLRELLSKLRSQIPESNILETGSDRIWLNQDLVYSDAQHFQSLIQPARDFHGNSQNSNLLSADVAEMLERAASLWRSPSFLAGARISNTPEFENWQRETSSKLELFRLQCLERLGNHYAATGNLDKAILFVQKALETDPVNEVLQAQLLTLLNSAGRVSEAQTYFSYLQDLYQREYDTPPPMPVQLALEEFSQETVGRKIDRLTMELPKKKGGHGFIGRSKELETLGNLFETGGVVFVTGKMGMGKTRFIRHFCNTLYHHPRVMHIHCRAQDENTPLQPLIYLIKQYIKREDWINLENRWLKSLSFLAPDVFRQKESTHPIHEWPSTEAREELFESIYHLLESCGRSSRLVLVFDDLQWCDLDTLHALMYLSNRELFGERGVLILSSRTEIQQLKARQGLISEKHHHFLSRISLKSLNQLETGFLISQVLTQEPTQEFIQRFHKATGGNPFFIVETIQYLVNLFGSDLSNFRDPIPLADNLSEILEERVRALDPKTLEVLSAGAGCGLDFQFDILAHLQICKPESLVQALEELETQGFIHPVKTIGISGQYAFHHSLIRDLILKQISPAREILLNEKLGEALISLRGPQINRLSGTVARHFEKAGKAVRAFSFWIKAALYARGLFSKDEALGAFEKANAIRMEHFHNIPESDLYSLFHEWGNFAYSLTDTIEMEKCYSAMYETGMEINSPLLTGAGLSGLGLVAFYKFEIDKSQTLLNQSQLILDKTDNLFEKIQVRSHLGVLLMTIGQNNKAIEVFSDAIHMGKDTPTHKVRKAVAHVQTQLSLLQSLMGKPKEAIVTAKAAQRNAYLLVTKPASLSYAHVVLAIAEYYSGNFSDAMKCLRNSNRLVENIQNKRAVAFSSIIEARINCIQGRLDTAWELAQKTLNIALKNGLFEFVSEAHCVMGDVYLIITDYDNAIHEYRLAQKSLEGTHPGINAMYRMGYAIAQSGKVEKGLQIIDEAIESANQCGYAVVRLPACYMRGMILEKMGKVEEARTIYQNVITESDTRGLSMLTYIGSHPQQQNIIEHTENSLTEVVLTNLIKLDALHPGRWSEVLQNKISQYNQFPCSLDKERLIIFLGSLTKPQ